MLLRFSCENAFCFDQEVTLSMIASADKKHQAHLSTGARPGAAAALRAAGVYGANGHGKTKLVDAILFAKMVACGHESALRDDVAFRLRKKATKEPSRFQIDFRVDETDYEYGFLILNKEIEQEWLFETRTRQSTLIFSRERIRPLPLEGDQYRYDFGSKIKKSRSPSKKFKIDDYLSFVSTGTNSNKSFLSEAVEKKILYLSSCLGWFNDTLQIVKANSAYNSLHIAADKSERLLNFLSEALRRADTGIGQLTLRKTNTPEDFLDKLPIAESAEALSRIKALSKGEAAMIGSADGPEMALQRKADGRFSILEFISKHKGSEGDVDFDLSDESSGTRRLLDLYPMLFHASEREMVYVVDELDRKLHPLLAYDLIKSFLDGDHGQLIFTTHTTYLLDLDLLRRDEVWLVQKKDSGASEVYSLNDFKIRPDLDIRKGYLQGRFGGIPFVGSPALLGWC